MQSYTDTKHLQGTVEGHQSLVSKLYDKLIALESRVRDLESEVRLLKMRQSNKTD